MPMLRLVDLANNQDLDDPNADPWDYDVESIDKAKLLSDPRVLADMRRLYEIEGGNFDSEEDMVNHWYRTLTGASVNIPIAAWELGSALNDDAETKHIKSRLARVHSHMPNPGEEGHPGWDEFAKGYGHAVWDPTNWFGASLALKGLRGAAVAGKIAKGKTVTSAVGKKGVGRAALYEGAISGAQEGALNAAGQARDISIGVRDRFSKSDFALQAGFGVALGAVFGSAIAAGATWFVGTRALNNVQKLRSAGWRDEDIAALTEQGFKKAWKQGLPAPHVERTPEGNTIGMFPEDATYQDGVPSGRPISDEEAEALDRPPHWGADTMTDEELAHGAGLEVPRASETDAAERILADQQRQLEEQLVDLRSQATTSDPESSLWDQIQQAASELSNVRKLQNWKARILREQSEIDELLASNDPNKIEIGRTRAIENAKTRAEYDTLVKRIASDPAEVDKLDGETINQLMGEGVDVSGQGGESKSLVREDADEFVDLGAEQEARAEKAAAEKAATDATDADHAARGDAGTDPDGTTTESTTTGPPAAAEPPAAATKGRPKTVFSDAHKDALREQGVSDEQLEKTRPFRLAAKLAKTAGIETKDVDGKNKSAQQILDEYDEHHKTLAEDAESIENNQVPVGEAPQITPDQQAAEFVRNMSRVFSTSSPQSLLNRDVVFLHIETSGLDENVENLAKDLWHTIYDQEPTSKHYLEGLDEQAVKWIEREINKRWKAVEKAMTPMLMANPEMKKMYGSTEGFLKASRARLETQVRADYLEGRIGPNRRKTGATQRAIDKVEGALGERSPEQISAMEEIAENFRIARAAMEQRNIERSFKGRAPEDNNKPLSQERDSLEGESSAKAYADLTGTKSPIKYRALGQEVLSDAKRADTENIDQRRDRESTIEDLNEKAAAGDTAARAEADALKKDSERIWKKAYAKRGSEVWYDPTTGRTYSSRNNVNVANNIVDDVDLGPKVSPDDVDATSINRRRELLRTKLNRASQHGPKNSEEAEQISDWEAELAALDKQADGAPGVSRAIGEEQAPDQPELIYDQDGLEHTVSSDDAGTVITQTGRKQSITDDGDVEIQDSVARTPEEHTDAINKAFADFQETKNTQAFHDAMSRINIEFGLEGTDLAMPTPLVKPGVRGGDRVVAIIKRDGDMSERKTKRVISQNQIAQGKGYRDLLGNANEADWIVGSVPRGISTSDPDFARHFVPDAPDDAPAIAKIPEGQPGSSQTPLASFIDQTFSLFSVSKDGGRAVTGPFADIYEKIWQVGRARPEYFDSAAVKEGSVVITGRNLDHLILDLGHGYPNSKTAAFSNTIAEHQDRITMLETMLEVRRELAPNGLKRPDEDLTVATDRLVKDIFADADEATKSVAKSVLERLSVAYKTSPGGAPGRAPIIREGESGFEFGHNTNQINVGDLGKGHVPDASRLIHETAHWAWDNILTDADKIQYLQMFQKYYKENGTLDIESLTGRSMESSTIKTNSLSSPGEFFASQFERWATQTVYRDQIGDQDFWKKMVNYMKAIFDRYMDGRRIDPEMERLFKKILPANEARAVAIRGPTTRAGTKPGQAILDRSWALEDIMERLDYALEGEDITEQLSSPVELMHYLFSLGGGNTGRNAFYPTAKIKMEIVGASRELKHALNLPEDINLERSIEVVSDIEPDSAEFARRAERIRVLLDEGVPGTTGTFYTVDAMRPIREIVEDIRQRLAKKFYNVEGEHYRPDNMPESVKKYAYRNKNGDFRAPGTSRRRVGNMYAAGRKQQARRKVQVEKDLEKALKMTRPDSGEAPVNTVSLKTLTDDELLGLWEKHSGAKFGKQIANEYGARVAARSLPAQPVEISAAVYGMNTKQLLVEARAAWRSGDSKMLQEYLYEFGRRAHNKNNPDKKINAVRSKHVIDIIRQEIADTVGDEANDGIPPHARANVREILTHFNHRNPELQLSQRRMMYRLLALAGRTQPGAQHENLVTTGDIYRLSKSDPLTGFRESPTAKHPDSVFGDFADPEFQHLRSSIKDVAFKMSKGDLDSVPMALNMVIRSGILSEDDMVILMREFKPIGREYEQAVQRARYKERGELGRLHAYADEEADAAVAWLATDTTELLLNKASEIGNPHLINIQDRVIEGLAYMLNGELKHTRLKKKFTMLDGYGDVFSPLRMGERHPLLDTLGRRTAIPSEYSVDYVAQLLESMAPDRHEALMSFIGRGLGRNGNSPLIFWHGTASGPLEASPDFRVTMSEDGSVMGPGFYITYGENSRKASRFYSTGAVSNRSYEKRIRQALDDGALTQEQAGSMLSISLDLMNARNVIRLNNHDIRNAHLYHPEYFDNADITLSDSLINQGIQKSQKLIKDARDVELFASDMLREHGIGDDPHMIPMVARINHPANFKDDMSYDIESPMIREIIDLGKITGALDENAVRVLERELASHKNGGDTYRSLVQGFSANRDSLGKAHAKRALAEFLENELGFDGMTYTHGFVDDNGDDVLFDAAVVWKESQVKSLTAKEFDNTSDVFSQHIVQPRADVADGVTPNGILMESHIADARARHGTFNFSPMGTALEEGGVPPATTDTMRNMMKGKKPTDSDMREVRKFNWMLQLRTNSSRIRQWGGDWFADWVSPMEGTGYYEKHHIMLSRNIMPIIKRLNAISAGHTAKGAISRWMSRSNPLSKNMSAEEENIAKALRRQPGSKFEKALTPAGREALAEIRGMFANELREMEKAGVITGKIENYFPQIWNTERIQKDMDPFRQAMARYFVHEAQDRGEPLNMSDALRRADGMTETLLLDDGINLPPVGGGSRDKVTDHIDYQRLIRLDQYPEMLEQLEPFLESNLRDVLVKYLDGTTSRLLFHNKFGVKNHGFYAYKKVIEEGEQGIVDLLTSDSIKLRPIKGRVGGETIVEHASFKHRIINAPFSNETRDQAEEAARAAMEIYRNRGKIAARKYIQGLSDQANPEWDKRAEAISEALRIVQDDVIIHAENLDHIEGMFNALQRKPVDAGSRFFGSQHKLSKGARNFTAVTLLGWTALTSTTDVVLPLIRSGSVKAWYRGIKDWAKNPNYRDMIRESGIAIENLVHERLVHQYGVDGSKLTTSFFNLSMLTPWTQMQREWAGLIGFNWMKAEQKNFFQYGKDHRLGKKAFRALKSYGLEHLMKEGAYQLHTPGDIVADDALKAGLIKFANQTIYAPNPNDIPLWSQTPIGAMIWQLKSFPMMMGRMVGGKHETKGIVQAAREGNTAPLLYFAALAPWFGAGSLAAKDYAQMRGGDTERESALRNRSLDKSLSSINVEEIAYTLGFDPAIHPDMDVWLGHYVEGFGHLGGLSLIGELMHSAAANADNGQYGVNRILSTIGGPSFGHVIGAVEAFQGLWSAGDEASGKRRAGVRAVASRIPILGGIRDFKEGVVDMIGGEPTKKSSGSSSSWGSSW